MIFICFLEAKCKIKIDQQTTCKMECFVWPPFEAPRRPRIASGASKTIPGRPKDGLQALQDVLHWEVPRDAALQIPFPTKRPKRDAHKLLQS